ncbi:hypothetical protein VPNG_03531 [Cytospora leucostoma]|uniref:Tim44-like domain-containing protein n=1 Tax=Cytospora leucostoma TaxID=1230097 RepID=A0A423XCX6_9PEZI|nr:hypothetical protein VPNG_03531 [Cytospora leucostoma]
MAATFRTRPLVLAKMRPTFISPLSGSLVSRAGIEQSRSYASKRLDPSFKQARANIRSQFRGQQATSTVMKEMTASDKLQESSKTAMLAPRTFIPLPLSKRPRQLKQVWRYHWEMTKQRFVDRLQIFINQYSSKPSFLKAARLRAKRGEVVSAARSLHATMSECLAKGGPAEKAQLSQICVPKLYRSLISAIENRPKGKSYRWERLAETGKPFWPRLVDHKWTDMDVGVKVSFRQAVVGIKSRQRLTELNAKGEEVSSKEMELLEYIVLWRSVDKTNFTQGDWQVYGTLKETTLADIETELQELNDIQKLSAENKMAKEREALGMK